MQSPGPVSSQRPGFDGMGPRPRGVELFIGSNLYRDTNGVVKIQGKEQIVVELQPEEGLLLLTMDLYASDGRHVAHLRRNIFAVNRFEQFAAEIHRSRPDMQADLPWVRLLDKRSGSPVLTARMTSKHRVHIESGRFYSHRGAPIEITPNYCRIGVHTTLFGEIVDQHGGMVSLGSEPSHPIAPQS